MAHPRKYKEPPPNKEDRRWRMGVVPVLKKGGTIKTADEYRHGGGLKRVRTDQLYDKEGTKRYQKGGSLSGPSHEKGGVKAKVNGKKTIELEGGEFIVNKESAKKYRKQLDKINNDKESTAKLKPLEDNRQHGMARKGRNVAKDPTTGRRKKVKHASNIYRKGGNLSEGKMYPGVG